MLRAALGIIMGLETGYLCFTMNFQAEWAEKGGFNVDNINWQSHLATRSSRMTSSEIRDLLTLLSLPDIISFAGGIPDPALFPVDMMKKAYNDILSDRTFSDNAMQYSASEGYLPLREWLAGKMGELGIPCDASNIFIVGGSQQALDFVGKVLISPNDTVLVTAPTYLGALQAFNVYEPRYEIVSANSNKTPAFYKESVAKANSKMKFAYLMSDFSNPSGETISLEDRVKYLDLAEALDVPIFEDAAYAFLRYEGEFITPMLALDIQRTGDINKTRTLFSGTFSKIFAPGLRVGWVCASKHIIDWLVLAKQAADLHTSTMNQMVVHRFATAIFDEHIEKLKAVYKMRRDNMLKALADFMPEGVKWNRPEGGMFIWVTLPEKIDCRKLLKKSVEEARVAFVPGKAFFANDEGSNTMRVNYSLADEAKIREGISKLANLIRKELEA